MRVPTTPGLQTTVVRLAGKYAVMNETGYVSEPGPSSEMPDWLTAVAIAIAIAILLVVFVWIVIRLEPVLSDFVAIDAPVATATPSD